MGTLVRWGVGVWGSSFVGESAYGKPPRVSACRNADTSWTSPRVLGVDRASGSGLTRGYTSSKCIGWSMGTRVGGWVCGSWIWVMFCLVKHKRCLLEV